MSYQKIEVALWAIERSIMTKHGCIAASQDMAPLRWYVDTGRASLDFLHRLMAAKPFLIARRLHQGGSYDEVIARIKTYLKMDQE